MNSQRLARYARLNALYARIKDEREELRAEILAADPATFPATWSVRITESRPEKLIGLQDIKDKSRKLYNALIDAGCVTRNPQLRLTVKRIAE